MIGLVAVVTRVLETSKSPTTKGGVIVTPTCVAAGGSSKLERYATTGVGGAVMVKGVLVALVRPLDWAVKV